MNFKLPHYFLILKHRIKEQMDKYRLLINSTLNNVNTYGIGLLVTSSIFYETRVKSVCGKRTRFQTHDVWKTIKNISPQFVTNYLQTA